MSVFISLYNYLTGYNKAQNEAQNEARFVIKIWHGGNQNIDEFYEKYENGDVNYMKKKVMILHIINPRTILDVKKELINRINYLKTTDTILRTATFGKILEDDQQLDELVQDHELTLFIVIPDW